jgi:hypothetical protein
MKIIKCPPYAPVLMESTRALGYSLEAAIADLIDNSISAQASQIKINFFPIGNPFLNIVDNGTGMSSDQLTLAMRYGSSSPLDERNKNDMGRFGLGMKTASLSQCRSMTVASLKDGELEARCWDLNEIYKSGEWDLQALDIEQINNLQCIDQLKAFSSGTIVIWQNLDRMFAGDLSPEQSFAEKMDKVRDHIALVFHRYLTGEPGLKKVNININNRPIEPLDPFMTKKSDQPMDIETIVVEHEKVTVTPYVLPHISKLTKEELEKLGNEDGLRRLQGFYVYRNKRLLVWGTWFRLMRQDDLYKLARVKVDVPNSLDHLWSLDIRKSTAAPPEIVRKNLSRIVGKIAEGSRRKWTVRGKKEISDVTSHVWVRITGREGIHYQINHEHPLFKLFSKKLSIHDLKQFEQLMKNIESSLPLNALYVDLKEDQVFASETEDFDDIRAQIFDIISQAEKSESKILLLNTLKNTEPYSLFPELLDQIIRSVSSDAKQ